MFAPGRVQPTAVPAGPPAGAAAAGATDTAVGTASDNTDTAAAAGVEAGPLAPLGLDEAAEALYRAVLRQPGQTLETLGQLIGRSLHEVSARVVGLERLGLVRRVDDIVVPEAPDRALAARVQLESRRLASAQARLATARMSLPDLLAEHRAGLTSSDATGPRSTDVGVEIVTAADTNATLLRLLVETAGDLWHLRRDQWTVPGTQVTDAALVRELTAGRTSRALYPTVALETVNFGIRSRIEAGEEVRVLPEVPSRLVVFGTEAALLTESWGSPGGRRLLVRQPALVAALGELAGALWERALAPPGPRPVRDAGGSDARTLLTLMARGAVDDQIARTLGVSMRTVRRRIAALLAELGVDSRFQAGAEAVRRGWI